MWFRSCCQLCHNVAKTIHEHHIKPVKEGGSDSSLNIVLLCPKCHRKAEAAFIPRPFLERLARERLTIEELVSEEDLEEPFEAKVHLTLSIWEGGGAKIHELCAFYNEDFLFCLYPPSIYGPRFHPQAMTGLWLAGEISTSKLLQKIHENDCKLDPRALSP